MRGSIKEVPGRNPRTNCYQYTNDVHSIAERVWKATGHIGHKFSVMRGAKYFPGEHKVGGGAMDQVMMPCIGESNA